MDYDKLTDRNVSQLDFAAEHLGRAAQIPVPPREYKGGEGQRIAANRPLPGSRPDGGMISAAATTHNTRSLIDQIMLNEQQLRQELSEARKLIEILEANLLGSENKIIELKDDLSRETSQREHFEGMLRQIATLVVNGAKDKPA